MKKINYLFIFIFILMIPSFVRAYDFTCDSGSFGYNESFNCYIDGVTANSEYDTLSGTVTVPDGLTCSKDVIDSGLTDSSSDKLKFSLTGTPLSTRAISFNCKVSTKLSESNTYQLFIKDFKSHIKGSKEDEVSEILRSTTINAKKYTEETTTKVTKSRNVSNGNSLLSSVTVDQDVTNDSGSSFKFSKYITEYENLQVTYDIKEITFTYLKNVESASVNITSETNKIEVKDNTVYTELDLGENTIDFEVTSEDGTSVTVYTFTINRLDKGKGLYNKNTDASLSNLDLTGYSINFQTDIYSYNITVESDVTTVAVNATPTVDGSSIIVNGNTNISNGSVISIVVTALDGETTQIYQIKVKKKADISLIVRYSILGGGALLIIIVAIFMIKKMNEKYKDDPIYQYKQKNKHAKKNKGKAVTNSQAVQAPVTPSIQAVNTNNVQNSTQVVQNNIPNQNVNNNQNNGSNLQ